jgi:serine/threonine protein kinase/class 3 adenylate cyclase
MTRARWRAERKDPRHGPLAFCATITTRGESSHHRMTALTPSQVRTALITDLVDSTRMVAAIGDAAAYELFTRHDRLARDLLARFDGIEIDKSDGFLLLFEHPARAVAFALAYHQALRQLSIDTGQQWRARVGIQMGQLFLHENSEADIALGAKPLEVEGLTKQIAARLMSLAQGGQTLLGPGAFDLAQGAGVTLPGHTLGWLAHGRYRIHGLEDAIAVHEVGIVGQAPLQAPPDSAKARRDISDDERETLGWRPGADLLVPGRPHWRLQRKLGAGGFGEVWLAEHDQSHAQQVFKFCHDPEQLRSLKREVTVFRLLREALGDRRDIARIIDWQFDQAPFFIESEFVGGGDLLDWAEARGGLRAIALNERLEITAQIADALAAAHSVGVLHKDIKPANVLIRTDRDGQPRAVLTDFGIGLVTDKAQLLARGITFAGLTEMIETGPTAGSQLYMAPELLEGKAATIQADLYALGVMLYELAAGEFKPLAPGWQRDIDCELLLADIADLVDGDPGRRTASATRVARDLRALPERRSKLAAERQAIADAETTRNALARAQRRRRWAGGIAATFALVSIAIGYSALEAATARDEAELRRGQAERLIGFMLDDFRKKLEPLGRLDLLDSIGVEAMNYFAQAGDDRLSDEELHRRAQALYQIGEVRIQQGELEGAAQALDQALGHYHALLEREPTHREWLFGLGQTEFWRGVVEWRRGDLAMTEAHWQRYSDLAVQLTELDPDEPRWQTELGYGWSNLGSVYQRQGRNEEALAAFRSLVAMLDTQVTLTPDDAAVLARSAVARNKVGAVLQALGRPREAMTEFDHEIELRQRLLTLTPEHQPRRHEWAVALAYRGGLHTWLGDFDLGTADVREAIATLDALTTADPDNRRWAHDLLTARHRLARVELLRGETAVALSMLEEIGPKVEDLVRSQPDYVQWHLILARIRAIRGQVLIELGRAPESLTLLETTRAELQQLLTDSPNSMHFHEVLIEADLVHALASFAIGSLASADTIERLHTDVLAQLDAHLDPALAALWLHLEHRIGQSRDGALLTRLDDAGYSHWPRLVSPGLRGFQSRPADR